MRSQDITDFEGKHGGITVIFADSKATAVQLQHNRSGGGEWQISGEDFLLNSADRESIVVSGIRITPEVRSNRDVVYRIKSKSQQFAALPSKIFDALQLRAKTADKGDTRIPKHYKEDKITFYVAAKLLESWITQHEERVATFDVRNLSSHLKAVFNQIAKALVELQNPSGQVRAAMSILAKPARKSQVA